MTRIFTKLRCALALGVINLARVAAYRVGVKLSLNRVRHIHAEVPGGPFFLELRAKAAPPLMPPTSKRFCFGLQSIPVGGAPPDWHRSILTGGRIANSARPWWQIPDFDDSVGDIKAIWELSRFDWVLAFAQRIATGEATEQQRLNDWLSDWCINNPPYRGANWKCGQEASIRVMHLAMAALILGQAEAPASALVELVRIHLLRIAPTLNYAVAQDNNHGTSEAAALFIGGSWLQSLGVRGSDRWSRMGRKWLENRAGRLIEDDGSFSQYSVNYHRVLLDTLSMVEVWRRHRNLPSFSALYITRAAAASTWLASMVDPCTGDAPNLGANDGAHLLPLANTDYRDFRPSVQLSMALFNKELAYAEQGAWNNQLEWLDVALPEKRAALSSCRVFDDGGYAVLKLADVMILLRYPRFHFRPSQADALHLDLWKSGDNLLRDAGSYSYNCDAQWLNYFPGTVSHNTIQFDDRDQMPRLSRFLFGDWLKTAEVRHLDITADGTSFGAGYRDGKGASHHRHLLLREDRLIVSDTIRGFNRFAVMRWRLRPGPWRLDGTTLTDGEHFVTVTADVPLVRFELVTGWESRYYLQKNEVPVLEVEVRRPGMLITEYHW